MINFIVITNCYWCYFVHWQLCQSLVLHPVSTIISLLKFFFLEFNWERIIIIGKVTFSWKSLATAYAVLFYIVMTGVVFIVGRERINILQTTKKFDDKIYAILFVIFLIPHFWIPVLYDLDFAHYIYKFFYLKSFFSLFFSSSVFFWLHFSLNLQIVSFKRVFFSLYISRKPHFSWFTVCWSTFQSDGVSSWSFR